MMKPLEPPKVTPDMSTDELTRVLYPVVMLNSLSEDKRLFVILGLLRFDFGNLGVKLQEIIYGEDK